MEHESTASSTVAYDAIVFEPIILKMTKNPRIHAVLAPGVILYIKLPADGSIPDSVPAVAFQDCYSYYGIVPTSHIGIGLRNTRVRFDVTTSEKAEQ